MTAKLCDAQGPDCHDEGDRVAREFAGQDARKGQGACEGQDSASISPSEQPFPSSGTARPYRTSPDRERRRSLSSFSSSIKGKLHPRKGSRSNATLATLKADEQHDDVQSVTAEEERFSGSTSPRLRRDTFDQPASAKDEQVASPSVLLSLLERLDEQVRTVSRMEDAINRLAKKQERRELLGGRDEEESEEGEQDGTKGKGKEVNQRKD